MTNVPYLARIHTYSAQNNAPTSGPIHGPAVPGAQNNPPTLGPLHGPVVASAHNNPQTPTTSYDLRMNGCLHLCRNVVTHTIVSIF